MTPKAGTASSPPDPPLRRLLPSEPSRWHSYPAAEPSASSSTPKRRQIAAACDACRQRKTKVGRLRRTLLPLSGAGFYPTY